MTKELPENITSLLAMPMLALSGVSVFLISTRPSRDMTDPFFACLDSEERQRANRWREPAKRDRFLTGRAALRQILSHLAGDVQPASAWRLWAPHDQKPILRAPPPVPIWFSLSYADHLIALAVSMTGDVGVDIEFRHDIPVDERPWHLFSTPEQTMLTALAEADFSKAFFRLWTLKEAIAKRIGTGFATEFSEIDTLDLEIDDGIERAAHLPKTLGWLFHAAIEIDDRPLHLAIATET